MKRIGKYQGKICYQLTKKEFLSDNHYENDKDIFIIFEDGLMIFKNKAFGRYDGRSVDEFEKPYTYYSPFDVTESLKVTEPQTPVTVGDFSEYSKCVDDFFANLKEVSV